MAEAYLALGQLREAEHFARRALAQEENCVLPDSLRTLGEIRLAQGAFAEAESLFKQAIALAQQNRDQFLEAYAWRGLGQLYWALGQGQTARVALNKALELFEVLGLTSEIESTQQLVVEL